MHALHAAAVALVLLGLAGWPQPASTSPPTSRPRAANARRTLETRAERTSYRETSRYDEVMAFVEAVD
jgi:hypothetical protein